ncbi:unnamed protein product [Leptosia nina]|uniref:Uncharacterized protein n=1 Tax=Leptosia nina TaxID=320188 RepID=A0AAV1JMX6_9NEOP
MEYYSVFIRTAIFSNFKGTWFLRRPLSWLRIRSDGSGRKVRSGIAWCAATAAANEGQLFSPYRAESVYFSRSPRHFGSEFQVCDHKSTTVKIRGGRTSLLARASQVHPVLLMAAGGERFPYAAVPLRRT